MPFSTRPPVFHVGLPKAGSTTLQWQVFPYLEGVTNLGLYPKNGPAPEAGVTVPCLVDKSVRRFYKEMFMRDGMTFDLERVKGLLADITANVGDTIPVFSNERATGVMFCYPDAVAKAERLHKVFGSDLRIVIVIREQRAILAAQYRDWPFDPLNPRKGKPLGFENWLKSLRQQAYYSFFELVKYDRIIGVYRELFGDNKVLILPLELLGSDKPCFANLLGGFMEVEPTQIEARLGQRPANAGHSARFNRARRWRRHLPEGLQIGRLLPQGPRDAILRLLQGGGKEAVSFSPALEDALRSEFAAGNERLAVWSGIDLKYLGYFMP
jgi:hypothetical protein